MCLIANEDSETNSVSLNTFVNFKSYSQHPDAFKENHEEANTLALLNN